VPELSQKRGSATNVVHFINAVIELFPLAIDLSETIIRSQTQVSTLLVGDVSVIPNSLSIDHGSPHAQMPSHYVFRAVGLPKDATNSDFQELRRFLKDGEELTLIGEDIVPSCPPDDTLTGLFGVKPPLPSFLDKQTSGSTSTSFTFSLRGEDVEIDRNFFGLTQLYSTEPEKPIVAE
jgi:hypothetical protein